MAKTFATLLKEARAKAGLNQMELAQRIGLTGSYISILEAGKKPPPTDKALKKMAQVLGLDAKYFLGVAHLERTPADIKETVQQLLAKPGLAKKLGGYFSDPYHIGQPDTTSSSSKGIFKKALRYQLTHSGQTASTGHQNRLPIFDEIPRISGQKISGKTTKWHLVPANQWNPRRYGFINKKDRGMLPKIEQGDLLLIDASDLPKNGDFVLAEVDNQALIRRFYKLSRDEFELLPLNPDLPPKRFAKDKAGIIKGVVIQIIRNL